MGQNGGVRMRERYLFGTKKELGTKKSNVKMAAKIKRWERSKLPLGFQWQFAATRMKGAYFFPFIPLNISSILGIPPIISIMFSTLR
jgi:hypothetical protein